jgi:pimeloyl-ACP methyl ester carboxylesterase
MPTFERDEATIYYEEYGGGFPVLLFAPGGMRSAIPFWENPPWNPIVELASDFRLIGMDQRNASDRSPAPVGAADGWHTYAADHVGLLDHLRIERCHVFGGCIGGPYCFGVIQEAPGRVAAAVLQQPIGTSPENRQAFYEMFDGWANGIRKHHPDLTDGDWSSFRSNMYDGDFLFNVDREFVRACTTPLLVLMGADLYHPTPISREIAELAPNAELVESWKEPDVLTQTVERVRSFLRQHTP